MSCVLGKREAARARAWCQVWSQVSIQGCSDVDGWCKDKDGVGAESMLLKCKFHETGCIGSQPGLLCFMFGRCKTLKGIVSGRGFCSP